MFPIQCEELGIDHLTPLLVVTMPYTCWFLWWTLYWRLQVTSSSAIWGCVLKGCFERGKFWRAKSRLKGIEDFNLEHWCWVAPRAASSRQIFQLRRTFIHVMMVGLAIFPISLDSSGFLWLESQTSRWVRSASLKQSIVYFFMEGLGGLSCPLELPF